MGQLTAYPVQGIGKRSSNKEGCFAPILWLQGQSNGAMIISPPNLVKASQIH
jgi:hypothetical protein